MANQESRLAIVIDSKEAEQNIKRLRTALKNIGKETVEAGSGLELLTEAMEPLKKYDSVFTKASGAAKDLAKSTKDMSKEVLAASKGVSALNDDTKKSADSSSKLQTAVDNTAKEVREFGAITDAAGVAVWGMGDKAEESAQDVDKLGDKAKDAKSGLKDLGDEADKSKSRLEKLKDSVSNFNESMSGLRNAGLVMAGALTGVLYKSVGAAKEFESAMADVKKVVDFDTPDGLENMRDELLELSKQIPITAEGFAQIAAAAGQSGIAADEIVVFAEAAAKMGTAFDITADQAGQAMAEMRVAFKMSQEEVGGLVDQINYLGDSTPNSAAKILDIVQRIGPLGDIAGVTADQIAAMGASITSLAPEQVATGLKNMMLRMTAGESATKAMRATWHDLGFTAEEVASGMQRDSKAMINSVLDAVRNADPNKQAAMINTLFGQEAIGVVSQLLNNSELLGDNLLAVGDATKYAGSAQKEFETRSATTENQMILMGNNINTAWIAIGDAVLPALNSIIESVIPVVEVMADWAKENPALVQGIIIVTGAISGLLLGVTGLGLAFSGAISMAAGLQAIGAVLAPVFAGLSLPIMGVVAAIAAVIAIGVALYKNWDTVKEKAGQLGSHLSSEFGGIGESIGGIVGEVKSSFDSIVDSVMPTMQAVADVFKGTFDSFKEIASGALQIVVTIVKTHFMGIVTTVSSVLQIALTVLKAGFDLMKNAVMTVMKIIVAIIDGDFKRIPKIMGEGISQGVAIVGNALGKIVNVIKDYGQRMFNLGKDFMQGFINGIKSIGSGVVSAASTMASNAVAAVRRTQDSHSPSKKTLKLGKDFGQGYAKGIKASKKPVVTEAQKLAQEAIKAVKDTIATLQRDIALFGNDDPVAAMLWDRANTDKYKGVDDSLFNQAVDLTKQKEALELAEKFKEALKGIQDSINGSVSTELEKWAIALYGGNKELSKLKANKKSELLGEAANLDFSNLSKEVAKGNLEIDRQIELMGARTDLDKELLKIGYDLTDTMAQYSYYLETGQEARYNELEALAMIRAEREKDLAVMKAQQSAGDAFYNMTDSMQSESPMGKLIAERDKRLEILEEARALEVISAQQHADTLLAIDQAYMDGKRDLLLNQSQDLFSGLSGLAKSFAGEQSGVYRALFAIEKGFAIAQSAIAIKTAVAKAMAAGVTPIDRAVFVGQAIAQGASIMNALKSIAMPVGQAHDGIMSVPKSGTWNLEKGERVLPAHTAKAMDKKLEKGGGTTVNIYNNAAGVEVEQKINDDGSIDVKIEKRIQQSWNNLANPNSHESKMLGRNVQAPRRR